MNDTITEILDQMRHAKLHKLVDDFIFTPKDRLYPDRLYIKFQPDTQTKTKITLQDYFLETHKSPSAFLENKSILRIDFGGPIPKFK